MIPVRNFYQIPLLPNIMETILIHLATIPLHKIQSKMIIDCIFFYQFQAVECILPNGSIQAMENFLLILACETMRRCLNYIIVALSIYVACKYNIMGLVLLGGKDLAENSGQLVDICFRLAAVHATNRETIYLALDLNRVRYFNKLCCSALTRKQIQMLEVIAFFWQQEFGGSWSSWKMLRFSSTIDALRGFKNQEAPHCTVYA